MATGYEDIDSLMSEQNKNLARQQELQDTIVDKSLQKTQNEVTRQKTEIDEEANKQARALYTDYQKQVDPYGAKAEELQAAGLANSGYAESSKVNLYNNYQRNVTSLMTNATKLKAEADFNMNQAYIDADVQKAQNSLALYQQQAQLLLTEYDLKQDRDKFEYQKERDRIADEQWERQFAFQQQQADLAQSNWERQYQAAMGGGSSRSSRSSGRSGRSGSSKSKGSSINLGGTTTETPQVANTKGNNTNVYSAAERALNSPLGKGGAKQVVQSAVANNKISNEDAQTILLALGL